MNLFRIAHFLTHALSATESIVGLIERHKSDQERLLRNVASGKFLLSLYFTRSTAQSPLVDLSNDIRGERLRFVEAMKEATAINVQSMSASSARLHVHRLIITAVHVEEFKKELTREVLLMTQEVGRLQKERQSLEQQIADLFSFYAKQKQSNVVSLEPNAGRKQYSLKLSCNSRNLGSEVLPVLVLGAAATLVLRG